MYKLAPSLLAADFGILKQQLEELERADVPYIHLDIMDGVFVPNLSFGLSVVQSIRKYTKMVFDVHLMIIEPERYVEQFAKAGTDIFCFHIEATKNAKELVAKIKQLGMKAAVALKPATPLSTIEELLPELDMVLVMTVEPGFGGQSFMEDMMPKIKEIRAAAPDIDIEVDGGVNPKTIKTAAFAGANVFVAGSAVFKSEDPAKTIEMLKDNAKSVTV